jgi:hypothetical protein
VLPSLIVIYHPYLRATKTLSVIYTCGLWWHGKLVPATEECVPFGLMLFVIGHTDCGHILNTFQTVALSGTFKCLYFHKDQSLATVRTCHKHANTGGDRSAENVTNPAGARTFYRPVILEWDNADNSQNNLRSALFCVITQQVVVIPCRRFGRVYQSHIQEPKSFFLDSWPLTMGPKYR